MMPLSALLRKRYRKLISEDEFLAAVCKMYSARDAKEMFRAATESRNADELETALLVAFSLPSFDLPASRLAELLFQTWHHSHEDIVSIMDKRRDPVFLDALVKVTGWVPEYLAFDDARALAVKAIWAIGNIGTSEAAEQLASLARSSTPVISKNAEGQLERIMRSDPAEGRPSTGSG